MRSILCGVAFFLLYTTVSYGAVWVLDVGQRKCVKGDFPMEKFIESYKKKNCKVDDGGGFYMATCGDLSYFIAPSKVKCDEILAMYQQKSKKR
ncbi:hypothetical protein COB52_06120 [Candidatus Kaiserbacteria bacterium]|nr:MAG: hypothetical protein COB52_06120 [Candidatus Kaiserbacteria bacterium]